MRCIRNRADAHTKKKIRMSCVGDAFERAQVQVRYESIFDSLLVLSTLFVAYRFSTCPER